MIYIPNYRETKDICHGIKMNDEQAIKIMADFFLNQNIFNDECFLIPVPNHNGYAEYTRKIAELMAQQTNAKVLDILKCKPHESLYEQKLKKRKLNLEIFKIGNIPKGKIFLIDNVIATGKTIYECNKALGIYTVPLAMGKVN